MPIGERYRLWLRRRRWRKAARDSAELLREFVYLDEVSVYSLMASKDGMIASEVTDAEASSLQAEVSSSMGVSSGIAKAELGSRVQSGETKSTQVLRKAIVQSTFRDLHTRVHDSLVILPPRQDVSPPKVASLDDLERLGVDGPWVIDPVALTRGRLIEMNVILGTEPLFQVRTVMSGVLDIIQDDPSLFGISDFGPIAQGAVVSRMLDKLLVGLVPLRGVAVDYVVVRSSCSRDLVVHRKVYEQLANLVGSNPIVLVGVAEQALSGRIFAVLYSPSRPTVSSHELDVVPFRLRGHRSNWSTCWLGWPRAWVTQCN